MCTQWIEKLTKKPAQQQALPAARSADEARDPDAVVKDDPSSDVTVSGTDVAVKRTKKTGRTGVPGLNL